MTNELVHETSPYLLQHAENPVHWYPWGDAAIQLARDENKPIFLSIGYASCHWCHVMEHESFENHEIASYLNEHFVSIKVDREERPDLDQLYMQAVMALRGGQGGWPLSVFLTPDHHVFYGGTYWPPTARSGMPGFIDVLKRVQEAFQSRRDEIAAQSKQITDWLQASSKAFSGTLDPDQLRAAVSEMDKHFDWDVGGFGGEPKFPQPSALSFLLNWATKPNNEMSDLHQRAIQMVESNLNAMQIGGINDLLGGGFARYSVDRNWLIPHFEKMLYDNAQLARLYAEAAVAFNDPIYTLTCERTLAFLLNEMQDRLGGFYSSLDADSEGVEGKFYVWDQSELQSNLLADDFEIFSKRFGVTRNGNFEGQNILFVARDITDIASEMGSTPERVSESLDRSFETLIAVRDKRVRPNCDDKVIASWNALAISAFARAGWRMNESRFINAATQAMDFTFRMLLSPDGRLMRSHRDGVSKPAAFLEDYAFTFCALLDLYDATWNEMWLEKAIDVSQDMLALFSDEQAALLFFTGLDQEELIARMKDRHDSSIPSGNAMAAEGLFRLGTILGDSSLIERSRGIVQELAEVFSKSPLGASHALIAACHHLLGHQAWVIVARTETEREQLRGRLRESWLPEISVVVRVQDSNHPHRCERLNPMFAGREDVKQATLFICEGTHCLPPIEGIDAIFAAIQNASYERQLN
ncbi:MAG: thioredoxin domain-containing protein [Pirellulaceae bacterium]